VSPRGPRRGQVNFRSHNSCLSLGASSPGRRRACVLFGVSFRGGYSPTGLPGDTAWLAFPPTGSGWLSVLSQRLRARRHAPPAASSPFSSHDTRGAGRASPGPRLLSCRRGRASRAIQADVLPSRSRRTTWRPRRWGPATAVSTVTRRLGRPWFSRPPSRPSACRSAWRWQQRRLETIAPPSGALWCPSLCDKGPEKLPQPRL